MYDKVTGSPQTIKSEDIVVQENPQVILSMELSFFPYQKPCLFTIMNAQVPVRVELQISVIDKEGVLVNLQPARFRILDDCNKGCFKESYYFKDSWREFSDKFCNSRTNIITFIVELKVFPVQMTTSIKFKPSKTKIMDVSSIETQDENNVASRDSFEVVDRNT